MAEEGQGKSRLGRGLAALIGDDATAFERDKPASSGEDGVRKVPIEFLTPNPFQPRHTFSKGKLDDLAASIRQKGILQPILVRPDPDKQDHFQIIAGERRWRAAQQAQLHEVPVIVQGLDDNESLEVAIIENVQRADLNAIEEAGGYQRLIEQFSYTQEKLSKLIGKSRSHVTNTLRLLGLPGPVQEMIREGALTAGHARALVGHPEAEKFAGRIVEQGLSVREAEALARAPASPEETTGVSRPRTGKHPDTIALEKDISDMLGLSFFIEERGDDGGHIRVVYNTLDQLDELCARLVQGRDPFC